MLYILFKMTKGWLPELDADIGRWRWRINNRFHNQILVENEMVL